MARTQADIANQMIQQVRVLDPSVSAAVGTPERKIIDTTAQALADAQIDLTALSGALDIDSKYGSNLDKFLAVLGFARQIATAATGVVYFSRTTPSNVDIRIPGGAQVASTATGSQVEPSDAPVTFVTTADVILPAGALSVAAPIQAVTAGAAGNVAATTITRFVGTPTLGVTAVSNPAPTINGTNAESDDELKIRFRNTVFRNVSGTEDQFLALAVASAFTTKANVVGPISRYREYVQVPAGNDSLTISGFAGAGLGSEWTTALSTIPYSKHTYDTVPVFVSNGAAAELTQFYVQDLDFVLNVTSTAKDRGDAHRQKLSGLGVDPTTAAASYLPNVTFYNVLAATANPAVQAVREGDVVLLEHSYLSSESRNDFTNHIANCVDVFIDGRNPTLATLIIPTPHVGSGVFSSSPISRLYLEHYRRIGEPEHRPVAGNYFSVMAFQPVVDLPDFLLIGTNTYYKGIHYWAVEEVSNIGGTIRSRNGIEWAATVPGQVSGDAPAGPYLGSIITSNTTTSAEINDYTFDKNIIDLQAAFEGSKQVTTDALAHSSRARYFRFDVTVMYAPGSSQSVVNQSVQTALRTFFAGQYFGTTIQLSDILQVIHNVSGVDNVRWTADSDVTKSRVTEANVSGQALIDGVVDRLNAGTASTPETQTYRFPNAPTTLTETYTITYAGNTTAPIAYNASASAITSALAAATPSAIPAAASGTGPFTLTFSSNGWRPSLVVVKSNFTTTTKTLNADFYLKDNELPALPDAAAPGETLAGLTIRPRAQNTWSS